MLRPVICQGRTISHEALEWLRGWIGTHRDWSRKRLARELCVLWDWRNGMGRLKDFAARSFLLQASRARTDRTAACARIQKEWAANGWVGEGGF